MTGSIRVLYVDDDPEFAATVQRRLSEAAEALTVDVVGDVAAALDAVETGRVDCVVGVPGVAAGPADDAGGAESADDNEGDSDPSASRLRFPEAVVEAHPELPVVAFVDPAGDPDGSGSVPAAYDAVRAGVSEWLPRSTDPAALSVLADRIAALVGETEQLPAVVENLPDPAVCLRVDGDPVVEDANAAFEGVFGIDRSTAVGEPPDELVRPVDAGDSGDSGGSDGPHGPADETASALDLSDWSPAEGPLRAEITRQTRRGRREFLLSVVPSGPRHAVATYTDITDRKGRERKLATLHEATRDLMDAETAADVARTAVEAAERILGVDLASVHFAREGVLEPVAATEGARELFGEVPSLPAGECVAWVAYEQGEACIAGDIREREGIANPDTPVRSELVLPLGEHGVLLVASRESNRFAETDEFLARMLAANVEAGLDRADREADLRERRRQVERQNDRLEEFASVVSHDLRNPVGRAKGYLQTVLSGDDPDRNALREVEIALDRIEEIIDDVLTMARQGGEVEETTVVDLRTVAGDCWSMAAVGDLELVVEDDLRVRANRGGLRQLLENLFRNVADHAEGATTVWVGVVGDPPEEVDGLLGDQTGEDAPSVGFYVEDDGPGIDPGDRQQVFESGHSTAPEGTGFGLPIVKEVADAHGWTVRIVEGRTGGARVEVTDVDPG